MDETKAPSTEADPSGSSVMEPSAPDSGPPVPDSSSPDGPSDSVLPQEGSSETGSQHVGFAVGEQVFAFCMTKVLEIIRVPHAVIVPMTPPALVGLANLRGRVLPVLDFRSLSDQEARDPDEASRVIVVDIGQIVGLLVDRVLRVIHVEERDVEPASDIESFIGRDLLDGVVKQNGGALIQLVDPEKVVALKFSMEDIQEVAEPSSMLSDLGRAKVVDAEEDDTNRLVSVALDGQDFGLPIQHVDEIVRVPETIGTVPNAPAHVLGIITLRNRVLPLVCMRRILGLPVHSIDDSNRVVVVRTADATGHLRRIGLVVDKVNAVIRVDPKAMSDVPELLSDSGRGEITAICRLEEGRRLVSVLAIEKMFQRDGAVTEVVAAHQDTTGPNDLGDHDMTAEDTDEDCQAIVFQMIDQEFGIMVEHVQEILRVPETMTEVPRTADYVEGMMNLRGGVLPVMDLRVRLGLPKQARTDRQRVIVLDLGGRRTGFIVDGVSEVLRMPAGAVIETPRLSSVEERMLDHAVKLDGGKRLILLVDPRALMSDPALANLPTAA